jgi:hypothetical protein
MVSKNPYAKDQIRITVYLGYKEAGLAIREQLRQKAKETGQTLNNYALNALKTAISK